MKNAIFALMAVMALTPAAVMADTITVRDENGDYRTIDDGSHIRSGTVASYMDVMKTTVVKTTQENAHSDTDFRANHPNPGKRTTETQVREEVRFR